MASKKIGIVLAADGEREFTVAMSNAANAVRQNQAAVKKLMAEYDNSQNSLEYLQKKNILLAEAVQKSDQRVRSAVDGLKNARDVQASAAKKLEELENSYKAAAAAQQRFTDAGDTNSRAYRDSARMTEDYARAIERQKFELTKCEGKIDSWREKIASAEAEQVKANRALDDNSKYLTEAENSTDKCAKSIDQFGHAVKSGIGDIREFGAAVDGVQEVTTGLGEKLGQAFVTRGVDVAVDALKNGAAAVADTMQDISAASADLQAKTGLSTAAMEKYNTVMNQVRANNYGDDYRDISSVMAEIVQIMGELDASGMQEITEGAITLRDTFDMDVNESIRAVDVMMKTMGVDAAEAFDLISAGAQNGLNRSGELADNLTEYSQIWGQAGFSAQEMFAILDNGMNSGAYNLDKINDYVKEFSISLSDGRIEDNLNSFSEETQNLFSQWQNGQASARDVFFSIISDLESMENQQEALTLASNTWSALGEDNAMQVLTALNDVNDAYRDVSGTMQELQNTKYGDLGSSLSQLGATISGDIVTPLAERALPLLQSAVDGANSALKNIFEQPKSELNELIDEMDAASDRARGMAESAISGYTAKTDEIDRVRALSDQLLALNSVENKNEIQKRNLKSIVDELSAQIPELASAYDAQRGAVSLTDTEIRHLTESTVELMKMQAAQTATQELMNSLVEAEIAYSQAADTADAMSARADVYRQEADLLADLQGQYAEYTAQIESANILGLDTSEYYDGIAELKNRYISFWDEMKNKGIITVDEYESAISSMSGVTSEELSRLYETALTNMESWGQEADNANKKANECGENVKKLGEDIDEYQGYVDDAVNSLRDAGAEHENTSDKILGMREALKNATDTTDESTASFLRNRDASEESASAYSASADSAEEAAERRKEAAEAVEEAEKSSLENIRQAYDDTRQQIEDSLRNGISFTKDGFDGGEDLTTEEINKALDQQLEGYRNYAENLEKLRSMVDESGKKIFSDETIQYIEDQGTGFANILNHICWTYENQGEYGLQQVEGINQKFVNAIDITDGIATSEAANRVALQSAMGELGSTDIEFSDLRDSIDRAIEDELDGWGDTLSSSLANELYAAVDDARAMGIKIPEGLADGIKNGNVTPQEAIGQITAAMQGQFSGLREVAESAGIDIPDYVAAGLEAGGSDMVAAFNSLIGLILNSDVYSDMQEKGSEIGDGTKSGIEAKRDGVSNAAKGNALAAANAIGASQNLFMQAGNKNMDSYNRAIDRKRAAVRASAQSVAMSAVSGINSSYHQYVNAGRNVSSGIALGIRSGSYRVQMASAAMARLALSTFNRTLGIHSPSVKFREAASWIPEGVVLGVRERQDGAVRVVEDLAYGMYDRASRWLSKIKTEQTVAVEDEAWFWNRIASITEDGTWGHQEAMSRYYQTTSGLSATLSRAIAGNFGIEDVQQSWNLHSTDKNLIAQAIRETKYDYEDGKRVEKSASDASADAYSRLKKMLERDDIKSGGLSDAYKLAYWQEAIKNFSSAYDEWYDIQNTIQSLQNNIAKESSLDARSQKTYEAAKDYLDKYQVLHNVSTAEELSYWEAVRERLTSGTDSWYDATKEIQSLQQQLIKEQEQAEQEYYSNLVKNQGNLLSNWRVYYSQSARADMEYWDICRRQLVAGTQERIDADNKYLQAKEKYYNELNNLNDQYAEDQRKINDDLANSVKSLNDAYQQAVDDSKQNILSKMNLFDVYDPEGTGGANRLIEALQSQVDTLAFWESQLTQLEGRGLSEELMDTLRGMGSDAAVEINALANATDEQLRAYQDLYDRRNALAESQAVKDNEKLREQSNREIEELRNNANDQLEKLKTEYNNNLENLNAGLDEHLRAAASALIDYNYDATASMLQGINRAWDSSAAIAREKGQEIVDNIAGQIQDIERLYSEISADALSAMDGGSALDNVIRLEQAAGYIRATIGGETMDLSAAPIALLNDAAGASVSTTVRVDNAGMAEIMQGLASGMVNGVVNALSNMGVYIDGDTLVGRIMPAVSEQIADAVIRRSGGVF